MFPLGKRLRVVKHCPEGHVMKVNWRTCPKCTGEEPELIRARGDLDRTVIRPAAPREPAPAATPAARPAAAVTTQPPRSMPSPPPAAPAPPAYVPPAAPAPPAYVPPAAPAPPAYVPPAAPAPPAYLPPAAPAPPSYVPPAAPAPPAHVPPAAPAPRVVVWQLVGIEGAVKGRAIVLSGPCVKIGKSPVPEAGARLETVDDAFMSREHLAVEPQGDAWILRDLGSRNGTVVNDEHVQERVLKHGDVVRAGHLAFRVERIEREAGA